MVDFVLVGTLLVFLFVGLLQLALTLHVRNVLTDSAVHGARFGALADRDPQDGAERTRTLISESLSPGYAEEVTGRLVELDGVTTVEIEVRAPVPIAGLIGVGRSLKVTGHALAEGP